MSAGIRNPATKHPPRTVKQKKYVQEYIKTGSAVQAVKNAYNVKDHQSALVMSGQLTQKIDISQALDKAGLTDEKLVKLLEDGMENSMTADGRKDYAIRHKYLETAFKLKGYWGDRMKLALERDGEKVRILLDLPMFD